MSRIHCLVLAVAATFGLVAIAVGPTAEKIISNHCPPLD
jgi:hypothetical protein